MTVLERMAVFVQRDDLVADAVRLDRVKRHLVDTWGARIAGSRLPEGRAISQAARLFDRGVARSVVEGCAQARCTEIDDIHLASCTTPGSVVVPTVLALAAAGEVRTVEDVCASALAGYEALIRYGVSIDGPAVIGRGVWPTQAAAAFGAAAAASRALRLSAERTAGALSTALTHRAGPPVPATPPSSSRWLTLGMAALAGVAAAFGAREGLVGLASADLDPHAASRLGRRFLFDEIGTKPYPTARQALAAIEAVRRIVVDRRLGPADVDRIDVWLPDVQRRIVDRPEPPTGRFASIVSVQYQMALALAAPERLAEIRRTPPFLDDRVRAVMARVRVRRDRALDRAYPDVWPARVVILARRQRFARLERHPHGDARHPFTWKETADKFCALVAPAVGERRVRRAVDDIRRARPDSPMPRLWELA